MFQWFKKKKSQAHRLLTPEEGKNIVASISEVEHLTTAEIRIHLEDTCSDEVYVRAKYWFEKLNMTQTQERNGVLIYVAVTDHKLAILGDKGIYEKVSPDYWVGIKDTLIRQFKAQQYAQGLNEAVLEVGKVLTKYFPNTSGTKRDELSNDISIS